MRQHGRVGSGQGSADVQRPFDGVLRGLVAQHGHRRVDVCPPPRLDRHIEELPDDDLASAQVEEIQGSADPLDGQAAAAQQFVGPTQQQIAEQDGRGGAVLLIGAAPPAGSVFGREHPVGGRSTPAGVRGVHEVVMDKGTGVQHLEGGAGSEQGHLVRRVGIDRAIAPIAERGPEPFAARDDQTGLSHQPLPVGAQRRQTEALLGEELLDRRLEPVPERRGIPVRRCSSGFRVGGGRAHAATLCQRPGPTWTGPVRWARDA